MNSSWQVERLQRLWGKTKPGIEDAEVFHPAIFHMLDVGHVATMLLEEQASMRWRRVLASSLNTDMDTIVAWLPWLIALHDIGKLSVPFQCQSEPQRERLIREGFHFGELKWKNGPSHGEISEIFIATDFDEDIPDGLRRALRDLAGGHHGFFTTPMTLAENKRLIRKEPVEWPEYRKEASRLLASILMTRSPEIWPEPANVSAAVMTLTGFTILTDWIGSNGVFFQPHSDLCLEEYVPLSRNQAKAAVQAAGFLVDTRSQASSRFTELFAGKSPRPIQAAINAIPEKVLSKPFLALIEAPTGEGKTEAALALAHRAAKTSGTNELYYALPTTATSNQMFGRLQAFLAQNLGLGAQVKLVHGQAFLFEDDLRVQPLTNDRSLEYQNSLEWFAPKKRAILAPFGVGTIDQAELVALNVKHVPLRMIGLAGKVLIIDEVHAYDVYMTTIIERMLNWLAVLGTSVILLSATLPKDRRTRLATAFHGDVPPDIQTDNAYPGLWVIGPAGNHHDAPVASHPDRSLYFDTNTLHLENHQADNAAQWLVQAVENGGCVCWLTNTVARAQAIFNAVDRISPVGIDRTLLHSQFPLDERLAREKQITEKYGPRNDARPERGIVIGTQVLEQSLDLDFDLMVTDLAPVDLVLQRAGRLHRHSRPRPTAYTFPKLFLNTPMEQGKLKLGSDRFVYDEYILRKSWDILKGLESINLPDDYRPLIEAVYSVGNVETDPLLQSTLVQLHRKQELEAQQAYQRLLPEPDPDDAFSGPAALNRFEESETEIGWIVARTRLGEETVTVIPLEKAGDCAHLNTVESTIEFYINREIPRDIQLSLLRHSLRISNRQVVKAIKSKYENEPSIFTDIPLLKECHPLWLENGVGKLQNGRERIQVSLDPRLGLVVRVEKGDN